MNKRNGYLGFILILVINLFLSVNTITAHAASAAIKISTDSKVVTKGNNITVSLTIEAEETIGEIEGYLSYDPDILEFIDADKSISGGDGVLRVAETMEDTQKASKKYKMKFKAKEVGIGEVEFSDTPFVYNYDNGKEMSVSTNHLSINVKATKLVSTDTSLSDLKISPGELAPEFDPYVYEYSTSVDSNVSSLVVSSNAKDSGASIKVKGNTDLKEGKNTVILTVKAESGDIKDYTIYVEKQSSKGEDTTDTEGTNENFKVINDDGRTYIENRYRYEIIEVPEDVSIPEGYSRTKIILYGVTVTGYTKPDDLNNDFILIYAMNNEEEAGFYQYDRVEQTMQRYMGSVTMNTNNNSSDEKTSDEYNGRLTQLAIIIAVLSAVCVLLILGIIKLYMKTKGYNDNDLE